MNTCIIIGAGDLALMNIEIKEGDLCIAADGGYAHCKRLGICPNLIIGDMDSLNEELRENVGEIERNSPEKIIRLCPEKDDTDTLAALKAGMERGYKNYRLYGAMGGRIEHTIANIQCLVYLKNHGADGYILDEGISISVIKDAKAVFGNRMEGYLSLFALGEKAEGVTITGMKYPLKNATITNGYPIGISNEFIGKESMVAVNDGMLLMVLSNR